MAARPLVGVQGADGETTGQTKLPAVFTAPIRPDVVQQVHTNINKNKRQPYAVKYEAGMQTSAESWGTGRAVSRIPRVPGGGTHRAGQGAFGNMCRGGRMFAPTKTWRKWHRKVNVNQKRFAVASALAASALPSLVLARGHRIEGISELPLVLDDSVESIDKTSKAVEVLKKVGAYADVEKAKKSKNLRRGKGKMRNRRYVLRKGPLLVVGEEASMAQQSFRNIPGVEVQPVNRLNLLQLAPGGHMGRFIIWTKSAFDSLDTIFGTADEESQVKKGYKLPRPTMSNPDLGRLINSDEIQSIVRPAKLRRSAKNLKKNPLKNLGSLLKLNPYAKSSRRAQLLLRGKREEANKLKMEKIAAGEKGSTKERDPERKKVSRKFIEDMRKESDYIGEDYEVFSAWLGVSQ
eukprot:jgi/Botrbrau1/21060/Bobra.0144s0059.1